MKQLQNKTAVITGAGSGMGRAMCILFASEGARVIAADMNEDGLNEVVKTVQSSGGEIASIKTNVGDEIEVKKMIAFAVSKFGTIDVLVNNAGIMDDFMPAAEASTELWRKVLAVNLDGPFFACREALPIMLKQGKGVIINISSVGGFTGSRAGVAYTSSKHALVGMSRNIGFMYAKNGVRCNAIAPGAVNTNIGKNMHPNSFGFEKLNLGLATNPRAGEASEIAEVALFLASDRSSFVNGSVMTVDGGWTAY